MMFFSCIKKLFVDADIIITESLSTVESSFSIHRSQLSEIKELIKICSSVPTRDKLEFNLDNYSEEVITIRNTEGNNDYVSDFLDNMDPDDEISITIQIDKYVSGNKYSIYDYPSFVNDLKKRSIIEILEWFSGILKSYSFIWFEVFDYDVSFSTRTMAFASDSNANFSSVIDRNERLMSCRDTAFFYNMDKYELIPDDFIIQGINRSGEELLSIFGRIATVLSLIYVVSASTINNEEINLQINGHRTLKCAVTFEQIVKNEKWISLYNWIYDGGNATDKMLIANNVMSLYCKYDNFFNTDDVMFEAIKTNYRLYLRNNVTHYLEMKRDISTFIQNIVSQVSDYTLSIFSKFKNNILAMCGFLFTVVLTQIGSQQNWTNIFTKHTIWLFELFLMGSIVYLFVCVIEARYRIKKIKIGYDKIKSNYEDLLSQFEINEAFKNDSLFNEVNKSALIGIIVWSLIWAILLIIGILVIEFLTTNRGLIFWLWNKLT